MSFLTVHRVPYWALLVALPLVASAQSAPARKLDFGQQEFQSRCASCHGRDGKGNGPIADLLRQSPPDLTQLSKQNGGIFPISRVYDSIVGDSVQAHGSRDMPVWGQLYRLRAGEHYVDTYYDPEAYVRVRVLALVEYLSRLQVSAKP
ncbi:MAG: cytochrome c [Limnohabitans sp.]|nr:cytochrome c [Limnohabitans sp.]